MDDLICTRIDVIREKLVMMFPFLEKEKLFYEYEKRNEFYRSLQKSLGMTDEDVKEILFVILKETEAIGTLAPVS